MFHICFAADEKYIKYAAVLITSIVKSVDTSKKFKDFFETSVYKKAKYNMWGGGSHIFDDFKKPPLNDDINSSLAHYEKLDYNALSKDEQSEGFIFHILSDFVSPTSRENLSNLAKELSKFYPCEVIIHICGNENIKNLPAYATHLTFFRLFIPEILPDSVKSCLYLDVDMLVCADLRELWTLHLENKVVGAVLDRASTREWINANSVYSFEFYFNAGFLLMNLCEFRKLNITKQCFSFLFHYKPYFADQDALNFIISQEKTLVLPLNFNLFPQTYDEKLDFRCEYTKEQIQIACASPIVLHFVAGAKPWNFEIYMDAKKALAVSFRWWQIALQTPFFNDDLIKAQVEKYQEMNAVYIEFKDKFKFRQIFDKYLGSVVFSLSKNINGYLKMPFVVKKIFKAKKREKLSIEAMENFCQNFKNSTLNSSNENASKIIFDFTKLATRAYNRRKELKLIFLPYKIYKIKKKMNLT